MINTADHVWVEINEGNEIVPLAECDLNTPCFHLRAAAKACWRVPRHLAEELTKCRRALDVIEDACMELRLK